MKRALTKLALALLGTLAAVGLGMLLMRQDARSLEHANHLYRDGLVDEAENLYRARAESDIIPGAAAYNLGTVLFSRGASEAAEVYLRMATEGTDSAAIQRSQYNLGYRYLAIAYEATTPDSALGLLMASVVSNRAALRLDPSHEDARWNLALAQIMLDSLVAMIGEQAAPMEVAIQTRNDEGGILIPQTGRVFGRQRLEMEAAAGDDPGTLSEAEARTLLEPVVTDVEGMIRGLLWSHRPDVDPWAEPYPGGNR